MYRTGKYRREQTSIEQKRQDHTQKHILGYRQEYMKRCLHTQFYKKKRKREDKN